MNNDFACVGNESLLQMPKVAFLASSVIPIGEVMSCYDWAIKMRKENNCVISGFSSKLEKDVWDFLVDGNQPIILVLARRMYHDIPDDMQKLLDSGRLLIVSTTSSHRQSRSTAFIRNKFICEQADRIVMVGVTATSSLFPLSNEFKSKLVSLQTT